MDLAAEFLSSCISTFESHKQLADRAISQVPDAELRRPLDAHTNSIAIIVKHIAGNLLSRWTDFLSTDGEKPGRDRDNEFVDTFTSRAEILVCWERGWNCLLTSLRSLTSDDLNRTVTIRGEPHSVPLAMQRSLAHTSYHVGQIVLIARVHAGETWTTLTIPRGGSQEYNAQRGFRP